VFNVKAKIMTA